MVKSDYYIWLLSKIEWVHECELTDILFFTTYEYAFEMDANRARAGENLRSIYAMENGLYLSDVHQGPCTVLEMLIALSDNLAFNTGLSVGEWFMTFITHLGLANQVDGDIDENYICQKLRIWMDRKYTPDGKGSLFPLHNSNVDCRNMEVWDQMNAYLVENFPVGNWME